MHSTEIESQMLRMLDGELSTSEAAELDQELITNPEIRQKWQSMARIHSALETRYAASKTGAQSTPVTTRRILEEQRRKVIRFSFFGTAATLVVGASMLWMLASPETTLRIATFRTALVSTVTLSDYSENEAPMGNILVAGSSQRVSTTRSLQPQVFILKSATKSTKFADYHDIDDIRVTTIAKPE